MCPSEYYNLVIGKVQNDETKKFGQTDSTNPPVDSSLIRGLETTIEEELLLIRRGASLLGE